MEKIKTVRTSIMITEIKEIYGAMHHGIQIFCHDGSSWYSISFTVGNFTIKGEFTKEED